MPQHTPKELRAEANRVRAMAQQMGREDVRQQMLDIAHLYEDMAHQVEMLEKQKDKLTNP